MPNSEELLMLAMSLAADVGAGIRERAGDARTSVWMKSGYAAPVTSADEWAETVLRERILAQRPHDGVLGEEGTSIEGDSGVVWVIDPIDGTTNFVYDLPGSAVSIGVEVDGVATAGVVADLTRGEVFAGEFGVGANRDGSGIAPSRVDSLERALIGTGIHPDPTERAAQVEVFRELLPRIGDLRRLGGCAVDICSVASGRLDGFYDFALKRWDLSAALLIATEAGAVVTQHEHYGDGLVICTAPGIHDELVSAVLAGLPGTPPS